MLTIICIIFMALIIGIGIWAGKAVSNSEQWSGGDKTLSAFSVGCILAALQIGGVSVVGGAQNGYVMGISGCWYSIAGGFFLVVIGLFSTTLKNKMPGVSVDAYLRTRYSKAPAYLYSYIWIVMAWFYIPVQLKTLAGIMQSVLPGFSLNAAMVVGLFAAAVYTGFAGMRGASIVGKIVCIGTYILLVIFVVRNMGSYGGYSGLIQKLPEGFDSLGQMPTHRIVAWAIGGTLSGLVMQSFLQPVLAAKSDGAAKAGCFVGYLLAAPICIFTAILGMFARVNTDTLGDGSTAFAYAIREMSSPVFAGLMFAFTIMIIAATLAGMVMSTGTIMGNVYKNQINKNASEKSILAVSRWGSIVFAFTCLIPAFLFPSESLTSLFTTVLYSATTPLFFAVIIGLFWKKVNTKAALASMICGAATSIVWVATGMTAQLDSVYPVVFVTVAAGTVVTLATGKEKVGGTVNA